MYIAQAEEFGVSSMLVAKLQARGLEIFTEAQIAALEAGICHGESMLVAAPTSSGKTTIAELAAVEGARKGHKTVYLVSHRALAEEKYRLFRKDYAEPGAEWFDVSIATGDRTEGNWNTGILVATYEKYLALLCSTGNLDLSGIVVVADEIQILGTDGRGPEIELLCTLIRKGQPKQIVSLSATISNPLDIGSWLGCSVVHTKSRDVPLQQEVWFRGKSVNCLAETDEVFEGRRKSPLPNDTLDVVDYLVKAKLGPVLVFTMTKPRALQLAKDYAEKRQRTAKGLEYVEQLELFSEPSTLVRSLIDITQKKVAFHTADLTYAERELVEQGLQKKLFDVVFATPTLASGVNFPFQTVVFDSFHRRFIPEEPWLPLAEYRNMAGRAGRLGLHDKGFAILLPSSDVEFDRARTLISAIVEPLYSQFLACSLRKVVLAVVASKVVRYRSSLLEFFRETLWWHQMQDRNAEKLDELPELLDRALEYLQESNLVTLSGKNVFATRLGVATAGTGLLPNSVVELIEIFKQHESVFTDEVESIPAILHSACASSEFGENGQKYLPYSRNRQPERNSSFWLRARKLFRAIDSVEDMDRVTNATYGLHEWIKGTAERSLRNMLPSIAYGQMQQLANDTAYILEGMSRVMRVPDADCAVHIPNRLSSLAERLRFGVPNELLDVMKASSKYVVPGFGRHRAMRLYEENLYLPNDVLKADRKVLAKIVESHERASALIEAVLDFYDAPLEALNARHISQAETLDIATSLVRESYEATGEAYETPILGLLQTVAEWKATKLDKGKRQGYPDFLIELEGMPIIIECKTKQKDTATISKEEAFAVLTKGTDFEKDHCVTIGKPDFDETSKGKANGSTEITLIRHQDFVEGMLRYASGKVTAAQLFEWFITPGYARIDQLEALAS